MHCCASGSSACFDLLKFSFDVCRAVCESRALKTGREILVNCGRFDSIEAVTCFAEQVRGNGKQPLLQPDE